MRYLFMAVALGLALVGCGPDDDETGGKGVSRAALNEVWCTRDGLEQPLRQTIFVVDERALTPGTGAEFRTGNARLFEALNAVASPVEGVNSGVMAPRERLTVYLAPADGGAPRMVFSGCAPGLSAEERAAVQAERSGIGDFVGGTLSGEMETAVEAYNRAFILGVVRMGDIPAPPPVRTGDFGRSSLVSSLRSVRDLGRDGEGVPRYFIFTDFTTFPDFPDVTAAREAGFELAREARLTLGGAEVVLVGSGSNGKPRARDFATAFFLGSQGELLGWGGGALGSLPAAPVEVRQYSGELIYPDTRYPVRLILGHDAQNRLVNSWLIVTSDAEWATPLGGSLKCTGDVCELLSDNSGLGQRWTTHPDGPPRFTADMPFSGMRGISAEITPESVRGEISDPDVDGFEDAPNVRSLPFEMTPF